MELSAVRTRRTRELTGPTPHSVAIVSSEPASPPARFLTVDYERVYIKLILIIVKNVYGSNYRLRVLLKLVSMVYIEINNYGFLDSVL